MLFSVIIPVYNVEKYLRESVDSVLKQGVDDLEILLVDDGSTDSSGAICDEYQKKYPNIIRVIHKQNEGLLLTRRCGLRAARGEWMVHLDSDDYMMPGVLEAVRKTICETDADLIIGKVAYGAADGKSVRELSMLPFTDGQQFDKSNKQPLYDQLLNGGYMTAIYQKIAKRTIVDIDADYSKYSRVSIAEDHLQTMPLLDRCTQAVFLDIPFVYYRTNMDSMTRQISYASARRSFWSKYDVFEAESGYLTKWKRPEDKVAATCAAHCRSLCRDLANMAKATEAGEEARFRAELNDIRNAPYWVTLFRRADKEKTGGFSRMCFWLVRHNNAALLKWVCRFF